MLESELLISKCCIEKEKKKDCIWEGGYVGYI